MKVLVVGAGIAGCTAAALLKGRHNVVVMEPWGIGGMCRTHEDGASVYGPHALHTDDEDVWRFLNGFDEWPRIDHEVYAMTDPGLFEIPRRADPVYSVYTEKAWGVPFESLPARVRNRVPSLCTDGRRGYHAGEYKGIPARGWNALCRSMLDGCSVIHEQWARGMQVDGCERMVFTGNINDYSPGARLPWLCRRWERHPGELPRDVINYCTRSVPQIRAWNEAAFGGPRGVVGVEFFAEPGHGRPCYPSQEEQYTTHADSIVWSARAGGDILAGRMATYQYLDIDQTVRQVMDSLSEGGLL